MTVRGIGLRAALAALTATLAGAPWPVQARPPAPVVSPPPDTAGARDGQGGCFSLTQLDNNHALSDRAVIFRVGVSQFYRLDFSQRCAALTYPDNRLILTPAAGLGQVCRALDLDVKVSEQGPGAIPEPCIPSSLYRLTPAEVAATPRRDLP